MNATRILLVDDFDDAREMYAIYLQYEGFDVISASTAAEALQLAVTERPDLILMDAGLPGMDGWDAIVELKKNPRTKDIPVLMLTGHVLQESQDRAARAGADGFIPKPCLPDELSREIHHALRAAPTLRTAESGTQQEDRIRTATADTRARLKRSRARKERS